VVLSPLVLWLACNGGDGDDTGFVPVSNGPPSLISVALSPDPPLAGEDLFALVEAVDPDGDEILLHYHWRLNGYVVEEADGDTLPAHTAIGGDEITLIVSLQDGFQYGDPVTLTVTYVNSGPVVDSVVITPTLAGVEDDLTCTAEAHDDDGTVPELFYAWTVDGSDPGVYDTLLRGPFPKGTEIVCIVTANDGDLVSDPLASDVLVIGNTPPGPPTIALDPDPPSPCESSSVEVLAQGEDPDGDTHTFRAEWTSSSGTVVCSDMSCPGGTFDDGATYTVSVYGHDGLHEGDPATLTFVATPSGESLGDDLDTDCDGLVDEWIDFAWQAQGLYWEDTEAAQLGFAIDVGDWTGSGADGVAAAASGTHEVLLFTDWDPDRPRARTADITLTDLPNTSALASGDVDGDGRDDLLLGITGYDDPRSDAGAIALIYGDDLQDGDGPEMASWLIAGSDSSERLGSAVALGDLDGDGYADMVLGQPDDDAPAREAGQVRVFFDTRAGSLDHADVIIEGTNREIHFGTAVGVAEDMDGDGTAELLVGAPDEDGVAADGGVVALFLGASLTSGGLDHATARVYGSDGNDGVGQQPTPAADVDGDGVADLAVAAFHDGGTIALMSGVDLLAGGDFSLTDGFASVTLDSTNSALGQYGRGPDLMDLDSDGQAELVAGASGTGWLYAWEGRDLSGSVGDVDAAIAIDQETSNDQFARAVAFADTDDDGIGDIVSSAYRSEVAASRGGALYVFRPPYFLVAEPWSPECEAVGSFLYCREQVDWDTARANCKRHGSDLARFDTDELASEAGTGAADRSRPATSRGGWWIGLTDRTQEGTWAWLDDSAETSVTSWGSGEPGSDAGRNCALMNDQGEGLWADRPCGDSYFYVCGS